MIVKILIADDHSLVREGLKKVLLEEPDFEVTAEAKNGDEIFSSLQKYKIDLLLMDITMPGRSGLDILKDIKNRYPKLPVLILSMHPEGLFALRAIKLGADGYLTKEAAPDELVHAIRKIISGSKYISESLSVMLASDIKPSLSLPHEKLSNREFEVLRLIASGKTLSEIALLMNLSITTVSTYRSRILDKMQMKSNSEITHYSILNGIL
jgi:two-component system, NarL family, invasion response regulator UvrY